MKIKDVMTKNVKLISPTTNLVEAAKKMKKVGLRIFADQLGQW
jgi:CBS domain-containing protein